MAKHSTERKCITACRYIINLDDIREHCGIKTPDISTCELEGYHIDAFHKKYITDRTTKFGELDLNTKLYHALEAGIFHYQPSAVFTKDDIFLFWEFKETPISTTPITVLNSARNIDSDKNEILYTLQLKNEHGRIDEFTIDKTSLFTKPGILGLIRHNFCIKDQRDSIEHVQNYFEEIIRLNKDTIPKHVAAESTGWKNNNSCFVIGENAYNDDGITKLQMLDSEISKRYTPTGNISDYVTGLKDIIESWPIARFMMYAGCSATILKLLGLTNCIIYVTGSSTTGKTKLCTLAVSPFHNELMTADATKTFQELYAEKNSCLPAFYDEGTGQEDRLNNIIYMLGNGRGKGRGKQYGDGINQGKGFSSVVFYNGENPIIKESDNVGKQVRTIEIKNPIQKTDMNKEMMDRIERVCSKNHGLLSDLFIKELFATKSEIPTAFNEYYSMFEKSNAAGERQKMHFAAFAVAGEILEAVFSKIGIANAAPFEIVDEFYRDIVIGKPIEDEWKKALKFILNWVASHEDVSIMDHTGPHVSSSQPREIVAWKVGPSGRESPKIDRLCFNPTKLREILKKEGFGPEKTIESWAEHGIIDAVYRKDKSGKVYGKPMTEHSKKLPNGQVIDAVKILIEHAEIALGRHLCQIEETKEKILEHYSERVHTNIQAETQLTLTDSFIRRYEKHDRSDILKYINQMCEANELPMMELK